jgi:phosphoserine phosphatase
MSCRRRGHQESVESRRILRVRRMDERHHSDPSEVRANSAIISGGFKELADRAQIELRIDHSLSACEYFFDEVTWKIHHYNLLPSDEEGKIDFMRLIAKEHGIDLQDCVFVGDGMNDVHPARAVGFSVAFNAQLQLREAASAVIDQAQGAEDFCAVAEAIRQNFSRRS